METTDLCLFNYICRLCGSRKDTVFPIFEECEENLGIVLKDVLPNININRNDLKPQHICFDCRSKLRMFSDFLQQCLDSDNKFNSCLEQADFNKSEDLLYVLKDGEVTTQTISQWIEIEERPIDLNKTKINSPKITGLVEESLDIISTSKLTDEQNCSILNKPLKEELVSDNESFKKTALNKKEHLKSDSTCNLLVLKEEMKYSNIIADEAVDVFVKTSLYSDISHEITVEETFDDDLSCEGSNDVSSNCKRNDVLNLWSDVIGAEEEIVTINEESSDGIIKSDIISCTICGRQFKKQTRLNAHMSQHTGIRSHRCSVCNKTYPMKHDLNKHMRIHTRTFACQVCDRPFTSKTLLKRHSMVHSGIKPVQCEICGKLLSSKQYLKLHTKSHFSANGNKSYVCISCPTVFKDSWSLREHYDKIHSTNPPVKFQCRICDKKFTWRTNYNRHVRRHNAEMGISL